MAYIAPFDFDTIGNFPSQYTGQLANGCQIANVLNAGLKQAMVRSPHYARATINSLQVVFPNWYAATDNFEKDPGATATVKASIEYPSGTFTQITFGGSVSGTITDGGQLVSDSLTIAIPYGAMFWVRAHYDTTAGLVYHATYPRSALSGWVTSATTTPDLTMSGTVTAPSANIGAFQPPLAIIGPTRRASVALIGDSRTGGFADTANISLDHGLLGRSVGSVCATINIGTPSDMLYNFLNRSTKRRSLLAYCSHAVTAYGINDVTNGRNLAQIQASLTSLCTLTGLPTWISTLSPISSGAWTLEDLSDQTTHANNSVRVAVNDSIRAGAITNAMGFIELADVVESSRNSGKWKAPGYTGDGTHELLLATLAIQASRTLPASLFQR